MRQEALGISPLTQVPGRYLVSGSKLNSVGWVVFAVATYFVASTTAGAGIAVSSILCIALSWFISNKTMWLFAFRRVTINSFWYLTYLAMIFFPAFYVYADQEGPYRASYLFSVESVLITVPAGWFLASLYSDSRTIEETERFFRAPVCDVQFASTLTSRFGYIFFLALVLTVLYIRSVEAIPLLHLIRYPGDFLELIALRAESFKLLNSRLTYLYFLARGLLYPFLILVSLGCYLRTRTRKWLVLFLACLLAGVFYASLSLARMPVAMIFLVVAIFLYLYRGGVLSRKAIAGLLILILAFPMIVIVVGRDVNLSYALSDIAGRMLYLPSEVVYYYFEVFPHDVGYLHGRSIEKLSWLLGWQPFDTAHHVGQYVSPNDEGNGLGQLSANGAFISDLNADFGLWGVILGGVLTGFIMQAFHISRIRKKKTVVNLACYAFLVLAFWGINQSSLPITLASNGALAVLFLAWFLERGSTGRSVLEGQFVRTSTRA